MSYLHCPYCEIKEDAKVKVVYEALQPIEGKCPDCGAFLDGGQHSVKVNGYADIYKGTLDLIEGVVERFNNYLDYLGIDVEDYDELNWCINLRPREIVDKLFVPHYGSTTQYNFMKAIGVDSEEIEFPLYAKEYEP